jgi:hypothetical protein
LVRNDLHDSFFGVYDLNKIFDFDKTSELVN